MTIIKYLGLWLAFCLGALLPGCSALPTQGTLTVRVENPPTDIPREAKIPSDATKVSAQSDAHPPISYSTEYQQPIPLPGAVNTAGAEDSPFITPDGRTLYFFFTPNLRIPAAQQVNDGVTGIYSSSRDGDQWGPTQRIWLEDRDQPALDGCEFVQGNLMWFCSTRAAYPGMQWFTARYRDEIWQDWQPAGFDPDDQVGELVFSADGSQLYFASTRPGGQGGIDIWMMAKAVNGWGEAVNLSAVNTSADEGWPAINAAEDELWFNRNYGIWRSRKAGGSWQPAEQVISPVSGEPTLDKDGNLYFVHHFLAGDQLVEADIYVAYRK